MTEKLLKRGRPSVRYAVRPDFAEPKKKKMCTYQPLPKHRQEQMVRDLTAQVLERIVCDDL